MNDMYTDHDDYRHDRDYRYDYRGDYRRNYREDYRRRPRNYRNYRNYREEQDYYFEMLNECIEDGMESSKAYEELAEMATNSRDRNSLMKMAEREKEHYRELKNIIDKHV